MAKEISDSRFKILANIKLTLTNLSKTSIFCQISSQSYKASTIINYNSRVVPDWKIPHILTLES